MKRKKRSSDAVSAVRAEMAKPRLARSVKREEPRLDPTLIVEPPCTTIAGTVRQIIPAGIRNEPEKAVIVLDGAQKRYRTIRIENTLIDEHGEDISLKKGAHVEVTVTPKDVNWHR